MGWIEQVGVNITREAINAAFSPPRRGRGGSSGCLVFLVALAGVGVAVVGVLAR
jgi:hypothetical protein